jgi:GTP-dependent phosphoenolpyruvate carboxykinase
VSAGENDFTGREFIHGEVRAMSVTGVAERWVDEVAGLTQPARVVWCDGSKPEYDALVQAMLGDGTLLPLNPRTYPDSYLHRSNPTDVARTEQLTFISTRERQDAGPTNNWMAPADARTKAGAWLRGAMHGRTMYVIPYLMGPAGSAMSRVGIMVTDSADRPVATSTSRSDRRRRMADAWRRSATVKTASPAWARG